MQIKEGPIDLDKEWGFFFFCNPQEEWLTEGGWQVGGTSLTEPYLWLDLFAFLLREL